MPSLPSNLCLPAFPHTVQHRTDRHSTTDLHVREAVQDFPSLIAPGQYNEGMLRGLDFVLEQARKRGLKAST